MDRLLEFPLRLSFRCLDHFDPNLVAQISKSLNGYRVAPMPPQYLPLLISGLPAVRR